MRKPGDDKDRPPPGGRALERLRDFARARGLGARPGDETEGPAAGDEREHAEEPAAAGDPAEPSEPQDKEERS